MACELLVVACIWGQFPDQGLNPGPLHWEHRVLTTVPPGKSPSFYFQSSTYITFEMNYVYVNYAAGSWVWLNFRVQPWSSSFMSVSPHTLKQALFFKPLKACETTEINIQCYQFDKYPQDERQLLCSSYLSSCLHTQSLTYAFSLFNNFQWEGWCVDVICHVPGEPI